MRFVCLWVVVVERYLLSLVQAILVLCCVGYMQGKWPDGRLRF